jgi:hypothetical protein
MIFSLNVLAWWAHRANIKRLFAGEEHRTSLKKMIKKISKHKIVKEFVL